MQIAHHYLMIMSTFLIILYALHTYRSALQGMGDTVIPMVSGMVEFGMRVSAAIFLPRFIGQEGIFYAEILAWSESVGRVSVPSVLFPLQENINAKKARKATKIFFIFTTETVSASQISAKVQLYFDKMLFFPTKILPLHQIF